MSHRGLMGLRLNHIPGYTPGNIIFTPLLIYILNYI